MCVTAGCPAVIAGETPWTADSLSGVGRIWFNTGEVCGAFLIAPRVAMTAAHCLFDDADGRLRSLDGMWVQVSWMGGQPAERRRVEAVGLHPGFLGGGSPNVARVAIDIALLGLEPPASEGSIAQVYALAEDSASSEQQVTVVSVDPSPGRRGLAIRACTILSRIQGTVSLDCPGAPGLSGSPLLVQRGDGRPAVLGVVSSTGTDQGQSVSLAALARRAIDPLWHDLCGRWPNPDAWSCLTGDGGLEFEWPW